MISLSLFILLIWRHSYKMICKMKLIQAHWEKVFYHQEIDGITVAIEKDQGRHQIIEHFELKKILLLIILI